MVLIYKVISITIIDYCESMSRGDASWEILFLEVFSKTELEMAFEECISNLW